MIRFTYDYLREQLSGLLDAGYEAMTCRDYVARKQALPSRAWVNRVDVDFSLKKADRLRQIFDELGVKATFFVRLHAPEYNPFDFENFRVLAAIQRSGHEIGYHSEIVDQAAVWGENPEASLRRDLAVMEAMLGERVVGVASHGGLTGLNNLDFWKTRRPGDFGVLYEAYDHEPAFNLFQESFYVSDSEWNRWKCYDKGRLIEGDRRAPAEHARDGHALLHTLVHPDTYYARHFYE
jgi:hypothetical protein